jgi:N-acetylmuramoyl-L-alanine amidase-like protein
VVKRAVLCCPALAACVLALAPAAGAATTRYAELTVATRAAASVQLLPVRRAPFAFDLLGARWRARSGVDVRVRVRGVRGRWSRWLRLAPDGSGPVSHAEPIWVPGSDSVQLRVRGAPGRVHLAFVASARTRVAPVRVPAAPPGQPEIIARAGWGADESLNRAPPRYAAALHMVFVHHTDTPNGYAPDDVPAIIRSIDVYHVRSNGWNDIGYNFLVDAYGRIFEGRAGGIDQPVIGAHTLGFNAGSAGIAVIGNGAVAPLTAAARDALERLIAWRLDVAHVDPLGHATLTSAGNDRFAAGRSATFRVVSGHRDALSTDCPGALIYPELDGIAAAAQALGSPKIVDATATPPGLAAGADGAVAPIVFRAQVLGGASWTLTVLDAHGAPVASSSGSGGDVAWTWNGARSDGTPLAAGTKLAYRIDALDAAGAPARPLLASLGALPIVVQAPPLALAPAVISPDGDGVDDVLAIGYTLAAPAAVTLDVLAPDGTVVATLVSNVQLPAGGQSARWDGEGLAGIVPDGIYGVQLHIVDGAGQIAERSGQIAVIRAVRKLRLSRTAVGPGRSLTVSWQQTQEATVAGELAIGAGRAPAALIEAVVEPGPQTLRVAAGQLATMQDGTYTMLLHARTAVGEQVLRASFRLDRRPPAARLVHLRVRGRQVFLAVRLSEAATVRVMAGARIVVPRRLHGAGLNGFRFRLPLGVPAKLRLRLADAAGNSARAGPFRPARRS